MSEAKRIAITTALRVARDFAEPARVHPRLDQMESIAQAAGLGKDDYVLLLSVASRDPLPQREEAHRAFLEVVGSWRGNAPAVLDFQREAHPREPATLHVWKGLEFAFELLDVGRACYVDPLATRRSADSPPAVGLLQQGLAALVRRTREYPGAGVYIGDYLPVPERGAPDETAALQDKKKEAALQKKIIEAAVREMAVAVEPKAEALLGRLDRWRSEFIVISREIYDLIQKHHTPFFYDIGLLALLVALRFDLPIDVVPLGEVPEGGKANPRRAFVQLVRVAFQLRQYGIERATPAELAAEEEPQAEPPSVAKPLRRRASPLDLGLIESREPDQFRSVYVMAEGFPLADRLSRLYDGTLPDDDPLHAFLSPKDKRGEVAAWGGPHWTLLDALTSRLTRPFVDAVRAVCQGLPSPEIRPERLAIYATNSLVIEGASERWNGLRSALIRATRPFIARMPLADEEIQKAEWHVRRGNLHVEENLKALRDAVAVYRHAGSPPLPSSRHFRLGFLVRLHKASVREGTPKRAEYLQYFLTRAEPPWYGSNGVPHLTIASGLDGTEDLGDLRRQLWDSIRQDFPAFQPRCLAIMGEDADNPVTVRFYDWLTETLVEEKRPGFKVIEWVDLNP